MSTLSPASPLAIVGIGCRVPRASNAGELWALISGGVDAVGTVPSDRWNVDRFYDPGGAPGYARTRWGGFVADVDHFDPRVFGISPREAVKVDPQQRLLLEASWGALEDAGMPLAEAAAARTGVFIGISAADYWMLQLDPTGRAELDAYTNLGGSLSIAANRISHAFDLKGPSVAVDAACASSLVAVSLACDALHAGRCDVAIVGGVNVLLKPEVTVAFSRAGMLSPRGRCHAFDASADGYVRGEGAAVVVIKPLARALSDRDRIYALIRGTAVNQDGRTSGITVPASESQAAMIRDALARSGIDPAEVDYVEAHGTGTPVGDPIEATAIGTALADGRTAPVRIGSIKTNLGHLEAAAGAVGLVKTALSLYHRRLVPSLHFHEPNPKIPFDALKIAVQQQQEPWPDSDRRIAAVNSFGFGGTNAHVVLEGAPEPVPRAAPRAWPVALAISTRTASALPALAERYAALPAGDDDLAVAHAAATRRGSETYRAVVVANGPDEMRSELARISTETSERLAPATEPDLAFVFTGMGPQWWAMGRELLEESPEFFESIKGCDRYFTRRAGWSLVEAMRADEASSRMQRTEVAQPANFALQVALTELLARYGVRPSWIVGHSTGEVAAAWAAGALDLEDAVDVIYHRSRLQQDTAGQGTMLAVGLSPEEAADAVAGEPRVSIAAINGPRSVTLAGDTAALEAIGRRLEGAGTFARLLRVEVPYHSPVMDPLEGALRGSLSDLCPRPARGRLVSTVFPEDDARVTLDAEYWWHNVRDTVRFEAATRRLLAEGATHFLEIGPHPVLATAIRETAAAREASVRVFATLRRQTTDRRALLTCLGDLFTAGAAIDWVAVHGGRADHRDLPRHPMERRPYWAESALSRMHRLAASSGPFLRDPLPGPAPSWRVELSTTSQQYLREHRVQGRAILPAAAMLEAMLEACRTMRGGEGVLALADVRFDRVLPLEDDVPAEVRVTAGPRVELTSSDDGVSWTSHASARPVAAALRADPVDLARFDAVEGKQPETSLYGDLSALGYDYGPAFQRLEEVVIAGGEVLGRLLLPGDDGGEHILHPALLDAAFQAVVAARSGREMLLPIGADLGACVRGRAPRRRACSSPG
jgi:acyl transferase domain-containing protein